jgi:hypothetical protein
MTLGFPVVHAARIRDCTRIAIAGEAIAVVAFLVSFTWPQAIVFSAIGPVALGALILALLELLGSVRFLLGLGVTIVGLAGVSLELAGTVGPVLEGTFVTSRLFGAGTILVGLWFVGLAFVAREGKLFAPEVSSSTIQGALGLMLVGSSWFFDTQLSLIIYGISILLAISLAPIFGELRRFGLPREAARPVAQESMTG